MKEATVVSRKLEKISIAPGEFGKFENWGDDMFIEEKCFPDEFPYGTVGYLSSCMNDPANDIGFAKYCTGQLMSADPKFRKDTSYIFFLLLVRELIHRKRCKQTYFRQATKLPNLTKDNILKIDKKNDKNQDRFGRHV